MATKAEVLKVEESQADRPIHQYIPEEGFSDERRAAVEKKLKRKLDARFSILVLIYILNYM